MVRLSVQPFPICQMHFNPFLYLQPTQAGPRLVPLSTELVRKAAFEISSSHTFSASSPPSFLLGPIPRFSCPRTNAGTCVNGTAGTSRVSPPYARSLSS